VLAYLVSGALVLPLALLALYFQLLERLISSESLPRLLLRLLQDLLALPWALPFLVVGIVGWFALAVLPAHRYIGAVGTVLVGLVSLARVFTSEGRPTSRGELALPLLAVLGLALASGLVVVERRLRGANHRDLSGGSRIRPHNEAGR
jgi:uncharacterized membrane protein YeaQ/YmgE (transglycosylase-associated protein family)